MSNETMTNARADEVFAAILGQAMQGTDARAAYENIAARLRGEAAQGVAVSEEMVERACLAYNGLEPSDARREMTRQALLAALSVAPAAPAVERAKVVMPEWPGEGWNPMETAPRDGTLLRLLVDFTDHAIEDGDRAPTIGHNSFDDTGEDLWQFAGWCWSHDHFTEGKGEPVGWLPMLDKEHHDRAAAPAPVAGDAVAAEWLSTIENARRILGEVGFTYRRKIGPFATQAVSAVHSLTAMHRSLSAALAQDRASQGAAAGVPEDALRQALLTHIPRITEKKIEAVVGYTRRLATAPSAPAQGAEREAG